MGLRLDWEIEAEQRQVQSTGEDPVSRRKRRVRRFRFLLAVISVPVLFALVFAVALWRVRRVDKNIEEDLRDTVDAEVAMLRIGDETAFLSVQRSAGDEWLVTQQATFNAYQDLKVEGDLQLTGHITDVAIEGQRGRVRVQEILNGVPYEQIWFYWRYDDGWRHVPPDYTFWGALNTLEGEAVTVRYRAVDARLATEIQTRLQTWIQGGCALLVCSAMPDIMVEIVPVASEAVSRVSETPLVIQVASPYVGRARADAPFDTALRVDVAALLAEYLVTQALTGRQPVYPADTFYLRQGIVSWLVGRFAEVNTNAFLVSSLAQNYGETVVGQLVQIMPPDSSMAILNQLTGTNLLSEANLDWRDLLTWRLRLEDELIAARDEGSFLNLYDTADPTVREVARRRFEANSPSGFRVVEAIIPDRSAAGVPQLRATVRVGQGDAAQYETVLFNLVNNVWRRAS